MRHWQISILIIITLISVLFQVRTLGPNITVNSLWEPVAVLLPGSVLDPGREILNIPFVFMAINTLTVLGLFFLGRQLFNWQIGALAAFLLASSSFFSAATLLTGRGVAAFSVTWGLYFLWKGLSRGTVVDFIVAGTIWSFGTYGARETSWMALMLIPILLAYRSVHETHFDHEKYDHARLSVTRGLVYSLLTAIVIAAPNIFHALQSGFYTPGILSAPAGYSIQAIGIIGSNIAQNFARIFVPAGGFSPFLFWPVGALVVIGCIRSVIKIIGGKREHGHIPSSHATVLSWLVVGTLGTGIALNGLPAGIGVVLPAAALLAAQGLWWLYTWTENWYTACDVHTISLPARHWRRVTIHESTAAATIATILFLAAVFIAEYSKL